MTVFNTIHDQTMPAAPSSAGESAGFRYYDGNSAQPHAVVPQVVGTHLRLASPSGDHVTVWTLESIRLPDSLRPPYTLTRRPDFGERLTVADEAAHALLAPHLKAVRTRARRSSFRKWAWASAAVWLLGFLFWLAFPSLIDGAVAFVPLKTERRLGEDVRDKVSVLMAKKKDGDVIWCRNAQGVAALDRLVDRLAAAEDSPYTFSVKVVDSRIMNAFAAPGGAILVTSALLEKAQSEEELAGVLAHEMGHVVERHGLRSMAGVYSLQMLGTVLFGSDGGFMGDATRGLAMQMTSSSWNRDYERAADAHAFALLRKVGISTAGLVSFFQRLEQDAAGDRSVFAYLGMLSSHPDTGERISTLQTLASEQGGIMGAAPLPQADWDAVQNICN